MISLAIAMGVGRFAFTPMFPLMVRDGLLNNENGTLLAASNYLGYLLGAMLAGRIKMKPSFLLVFGLLSTAALTGAVGWTSSVFVWVLLRFVAGIMSAWTLVATSAWGLAWLAAIRRQHLAGTIFAGVGLGIAAVGVFCAVTAQFAVPAVKMWIDLALLAGILALFPWIVSAQLPSAISNVGGATQPSSSSNPPSNTMGLVICYSLFGFGYILPATYLPAQARQLVKDPNVFVWAWPIFGLAAAASTVFVSLKLKRANRMQVWAAAHFLMAIGVLSPVAWHSITSICMAALLVGGTFMVVTMVAMQEARARAEASATMVLSRMTAGFALGQLLGPVIFGILGYFSANASAALNQGLELASAALFVSAIYLWKENCCRNCLLAMSLRFAFKRNQICSTGPICVSLTKLLCRLATCWFVFTTRHSTTKMH
jgi:MFS family permease